MDKNLTITKTETMMDLVVLELLLEYSTHHTRVTVKYWGVKSIPILAVKLVIHVYAILDFCSSLGFFSSPLVFRLMIESG
jgi:hypothetical protein